MALFAAVRCAKITDIKHLARCEQHGKRQDPSSQKRVDSSRTSDNISGSPYGKPGLDLVAQFKALKARTGAKEYGKAPIGLHLLAVISPDAIRDAGDIHDPKNPVNRKLITQAVKWAQSEFGKEAVFGARLDLDEDGGGVVDLFISPVSEITQRGKSKRIISVNKAMTAISKRHGTKYSYSALQDSWANWAANTVDRRLERGKLKTETAREHVHADAFILVAKAEERRQRNSPVARITAALRSGSSQAIDEAVGKELEKHEKKVSMLTKTIEIESRRNVAQGRRIKKLQSQVKELQASDTTHLQRAMDAEDAAVGVTGVLVSVCNETKADIREVLDGIEKHDRSLFDVIIDILKRYFGSTYEKAYGADEQKLKISL